LFTVVYHYKIPIEKTRDYIQLEKQAIKIYLECGCSGVEIYRDAIYPARWMEINRFEDREHYQRVVGVVDEDPRMRELFEEFKSILGSEGGEAEKRLYYRMI